MSPSGTCWHDKAISVRIGKSLARGEKIDAQSGCIRRGDSRHWHSVWRALAQTGQRDRWSRSSSRSARRRPAGRRGSRKARTQLTADDVNAWLDGFMPYALGKGDIPGAVVVVVKDGQVLTERGYGYADVAKKTQGRSEDDAVPARLDLQAVHLDRGDAAGRAGQGRPRRRRQQVPRFQDSALRGQADHPPQPHDPHAGLRGAGQGPDHARPEATTCRSTRS